MERRSRRKLVPGNERGRWIGKKGGRKSDRVNIKRERDHLATMVRPTDPPATTPSRVPPSNATLSLLYPDSPSTLRFYFPLCHSPVLSVFLSFHPWHDISPFRRSILLSSNAPWLVWAPTERYHIKFRVLCSERFWKPLHIAKVFSTWIRPARGYYLYLSHVTGDHRSIRLCICVCVRVSYYLFPFFLPYYPLSLSLSFLLNANLLVCSINFTVP